MENITQVELDLYAQGCGGVVLVGRMSAFADAVLETEGAANVLVCARSPRPGGGSGFCGSAAALFRATEWPTAAASVSAGVGSAPTASSNATEAEGVKTSHRLPYTLLVDARDLQARVRGSDGSAEEFPPVCTVRLAFPARGPRKSSAPYLRRRAKELGGQWVRAVAVPRRYSFECEGRDGAPVRRTGVRLELTALFPAQ